MTGNGDSERAPLLAEGSHTAYGDSHHHERAIRKPPSSPKHLHRVTLRLEYIITQLIPEQVKTSHITLPSKSNIITDDAVIACKEAGQRQPGKAAQDGVDAASLEEEKEWAYCVPFCLLLCKKRFYLLGRKDPADSDVMESRSLACEFLAKDVLNKYDLEPWQIGSKLLARRWDLGKGHWYRGMVPARHLSALELGIDLHASWFCSDGAVQKTVQALWNGHLVQVQDEHGHFVFEKYAHINSRSFLDHLDPARLNVPKYQNLMSIVISLTFLVIYSIVTLTPKWEEPTPLEIVMYVFVLGSICDEIAKASRIVYVIFLLIPQVHKVGLKYVFLDIWKFISMMMYTLFTASLVLRIMSLTTNDQEKREVYNYQHYAYCLSPAAVLVWSRCLVVFDNYPIFGSSIVVLRTLMAESATFFLLLGFIIISFAQSFLIIDAGDGSVSDFWAIIDSLMRGFLQSPDFDKGLDFGVVGLVLYDFYVFLVAVILLNMLVALYAQAYASVTDDTINQFLTARTGKTVNFLRAPDEYHFIVPFNLIEVIFLVPLEPFLNRTTYATLNRRFMTACFAPALAVIAWYESRIDVARMLNRAQKKSKGQRPDEEAISAIDEEQGAIRDPWEDPFDICDTDEEQYEEHEDASYGYGSDAEAEISWRKKLVKEITPTVDEVNEDESSHALLKHMLRELTTLRNEIKEL